MADKPKIEGAPGLTWRPRKESWEARWQARSDLVARGYEPKSVRLWAGTAPSPDEALFIADRCTSLQAEMLAWGNGIVQDSTALQFTGTMASLIDCYSTDKDSPYHNMRFEPRRNRLRLLNRLREAYGKIELTEVKARDIKQWHEKWSTGGKVASAHGMVGCLRTMFGFGATILESTECERISVVMHRMRFTMAKPRNERLTAEQAIAIRKAAHAAGLRSIALAQALQFECMLRQKDVIGEWVPLGEPGVSEVIEGSEKWLRGLRWEEMDADMILRHVTSKRGKALEVPLKDAPMVVEELRQIDIWPARGPMVVCETTGRPWKTGTFRIRWRKLANACGIPKSVRNMDTRAGAITEATEAGADLEHIKHAATHSDISMTQRYARGGEEKTAGVLRKRAAHRNKTGTS